MCGNRVFTCKREKICSGVDLKAISGNVEKINCLSDNMIEDAPMGPANGVVKTGTAREEAEKLASEIVEFPQHCMRGDRKAVYRWFW